MIRDARICLKLTLGLALASALDTAAQLSWKEAVSTIPDASPRAMLDAILDGHEQVRLG